MKQIVQLCEKTTNKTAQEIKNTESSLERNASQSQYHAIQTEINANEDSKINLAEADGWSYYNQEGCLEEFLESKGSFYEGNVRSDNSDNDEKNYNERVKAFEIIRART